MSSRLARSLLAAVVLLGPASTKAQIVDPPGGSLRLTIALHRTTYLLGEPVYVTATLHNGSLATVSVLGDLDPQVGALELRVGAIDSGKLLFSPTAVADVDGPAIELAPGDEIAATVPVFFGAKSWTFAVGEYAVSATYDDNPGDGIPGLESNEVHFSVADDEARAGEFLVSGPEGEEAGRFLLWRGGDHLEGGIARLNALIASHPTSPLVDYARFALGVSRSRSFMNYLRNETRRPDCAGAMDQLSQVSTARFPASLIALKDSAEASCTGSSPAETVLTAEPAIVELGIDPTPLIPVARVNLRFGATLHRADDGQPLPGMQVVFSAGTFQCAATTDAGGFATCGGIVEQVNAVLGLGYSATFAGTSTLQAASAEGALVELVGVALP